jgi:hypothetical protein
MTTMTPKQIRKYLGHWNGNRIVRIIKDGRVIYCGLINDTDRPINPARYEAEVAEVGVVSH